MLKLINIICLFIFSSAYAGPWNILELDDLRLQYKNFLPGGSDPLITQNGLLNRDLDKQLNLIMNSSILDYMFFNNTISTMTDQQLSPQARGQFRTISWDFKLGLRTTSFLNISYAHKSEHLLDTVYSAGRFPTQDSIMLEFIFFTKDKKESIINL